MMRNPKKLMIEQLDRKLKPFQGVKEVQPPAKGWIHSIRTTLNMSLEQLGQKLNITRQGASRVEKSEAGGSISLNSLNKAGNAMGMKLVYGFVPIHGSVEDLIEERSRQLAEKIVMRTDHNMLLEDQGNGPERIKTAIDELTIEIKREMRRSIWD